MGNRITEYSIHILIFYRLDSIGAFCELIFWYPDPVTQEDRIKPDPDPNPKHYTSNTLCNVHVHDKTQQCRAQNKDLSITKGCPFWLVSIITIHDTKLSPANHVSLSANSSSLIGRYLELQLDM